MAVVPLWLPPVKEWDKIEKKNGNSSYRNILLKSRKILNSLA